MSDLLNGKQKRTRLVHAMRAVWMAQDTVAEVIAEEWPIGGVVNFQRGRSDTPKLGKVLALGTDKLLIHAETGREYWISAYDVLKADPEIAETLFGGRHDRRHHTAVG